MTQRSINLLALAIVVIGGGAIAGWALLTSHGDDPTHPAPGSASGSAPASRDAGPVTHPMPFDIYTDVKVGDWCAYRDEADLGPVGKLTSTELIDFPIATPRDVSRAAHVRDDGSTTVQDPTPVVLPRHGLTLEAFAQVAGTLSDVEVHVDERTEGDRVFRTTRISFATHDPDKPATQTHTDVWISDDVPCGVVYERSASETAGVRTTTSREVLGYGNGGAARFGQRPAGL